MYLAELAAHAWDLARATGQLDKLDPSLALPALEGARAMIKPQYRNMVEPGSPFGAEVPRLPTLTTGNASPPSWDATRGQFSARPLDSLRRVCLISSVSPRLAGSWARSTMSAGRPQLDDGRAPAARQAPPEPAAKPRLYRCLRRLPPRPSPASSAASLVSNEVVHDARGVGRAPAGAEVPAR